MNDVPSPTGSTIQWDRKKCTDIHHYNSELKSWILVSVAALDHALACELLGGELGQHPATHGKWWLVSFIQVYFNVSTEATGWLCFYDTEWGSCWVPGLGQFSFITQISFLPLRVLTWLLQEIARKICHAGLPQSHRTHASGGCSSRSIRLSSEHESDK